MKTDPSQIFLAKCIPAARLVGLATMYINRICIVYQYRNANAVTY